MKKLVNFFVFCTVLSMAQIAQAQSCESSSAQIISQNFEIVEDATYCAAVVSATSYYAESAFCALSQSEILGAEIELTPAQCEVAKDGTLSGVIVESNGQYFLD
ncbi:MAG: hypothetical protein KC478_05225 [Bacteriovoracaceae bacterium]|nr:hypothetical protein [Bacteriovoracaceae bacterium]